MTKKIIHIDLDSYYVAIEARDNPKLRGIPLAVGGSQFKRGVIATCSYEARSYGVRSAMATAHALKLCPQLTVISGNMEKYKAVSRQVNEIFQRYTDIIEPLSLDEAYLDVTNSPFCKGSATLIAQDIRAVIKSELNLTASAGVAPIKFVAKVASDINKPNGIFIVNPHEVESFVEKLELGKIPGVGKVTLEKLNGLGLFVGKDVKNYDKHLLIKNFGKFGQVLWERCHGIDKRSIEVSRVRKSVGIEKTLVNDIYVESECIDVINALFPCLVERLVKVSPDLKITRQGLKVKFDDFSQTTVEFKKDFLEKVFFLKLLSQALKRQNGRGIRLIGLNVGLNTEQNEVQQMSFEW